VLIDVYAASVSYMDYLMISGGYQMRPPLPYVPGTDAAGIVVAVGGDVDRFRPGDRVACEGWYGGYAERMTAKASRTSRLPDNIDFSTGSTVLHIYLTAYYALVDRAGLKRARLSWSRAHLVVSALLASNSPTCLAPA
jgi:NADPH:quinone reductase